MDSVPTLSVGSVDGDSTTQLFNVAGAFRTDDGGLVIANAGTSQIRFYAADGSFVRSVGSEGEGPGEFESMSSLYPASAGDGFSDGFHVLDRANSRVSRYSAAGDYLGAVTLTPPPGGRAPELAGVTPRGEFIAWVRPTGSAAEGLVRDSVMLLRFDSTGFAADTLGRYAGPEQFVNIERSGNSISIYKTFNPYPRTFIAAASPYGIAAGATDSAVIDFFPPDGTRARTIRWDAQPAVFDDDAMGRYADHLVQSAAEDGQPMSPSDAAQQRKRMLETPHAAALPVFDRILVDRSGNAWVRDYDLLGVSNDWRIFRPDGTAAGRLTMPPRSRPVDIGADFVVAVMRDSLDIEYVRVFGLKKG
jgi:hypothetical protein